MSTRNHEPGLRRPPDLASPAKESRRNKNSRDNNTSTWTPKVCKIMAFMAAFMGLRIFFAHFWAPGTGNSSRNKSSNGSNQMNGSNNSNIKGNKSDNHSEPM